MKEDATQIYFLSNTGISCLRPQIAIMELVVPQYAPPSWAERKREHLIRKLKANKARLNKVKIALIMLPASLIILSIVIALAYLTGGEFTGILLGILGAQCIIALYLTLTGMLECDADLIRVKHKRKIYY